MVTAKASLVLLTKLSDNLNENRHVVGIECTIVKETAASATKTLLSVNPRLQSVFQACLRSSDLCGALSEIHKVKHFQDAFNHTVVCVDPSSCNYNSLRGQFASTLDELKESIVNKLDNAKSDPNCDI